jgi:MarR family transcriptional regulator, lower aerobic nicotinate degradation pathway regulator
LSTLATPSYSRRTVNSLDDYDPPQRVRRQPSWLASQLARRAQLLVAEELAPEGMRRQHFVVLASLADQGPASQADLGRRLWIDRSDLHALATELERDGLIARVRDERDRRRNVVTLTTAGRAAMKRLQKRIDAAQNALLDPLSDTERRELVRLLELAVYGDERRPGA